MSAKEAGPKGLAGRMLPHQTDFVDTVLNRTGGRVVFLRADVGLGRSAALVALSNRVIRAQPDGRILLACPASLCDQWVEMMGEEGVPALHVNRFKFREMLDAAPTDELWPGGVVAVVSYDFAKQPDVSKSLGETRWELLIADEAHKLVGSRGQLFGDLEKAADRFVLASGREVPADVLRMSDAKLVEWRRDRLVGLDGKPILTMPEPAVREVTFTLSRTEKALEEIVSELRSTLEMGTGREGVAARLLWRGFSSSFASLEGVLRRIEQATEDRFGSEPQVEDVDEDSTDEGSLLVLDSIASERARALASHALERLESIQVDSKLSALATLLDHLTEEGRARDKRICVLGEYRSTIYYLGSHLEEQGFSTWKIHSGISYETRRDHLRRFANSGGVLAASRAVMTEALILPDVTDLVLFDLPPTAGAMRQVIARFQQLGRSSPLRVHALVETSSPGAASGESLRLLREMGSTPRRKVQTEDQGPEGES